MAKALSLVTEVTERPGSQPGADHPDTLVAANNLSCYLRCIGRLDEALQARGGHAEPDAAQARRDCTHSPWPARSTWPTASVTPVNLAAAEALERETISQLTRCLGAEHPDTLVCQANLAVTLREAGRDQEAKELKAKVLADLARVLGAGHPDVAQLREGQRINRDLEPHNI